ncbi:MAG: hypothetical protein ABFR31_03080 [Thermodesulfobacteriota bacterium]
MKNLLLTSLFFIIGIGFFASHGFAEENNKAWEPEFVQALLQGKATINTSSEENVLDKAIKQAIVVNNAPAHQVMKIAVDLKYNPYSVIKSIVSNGGAPDLDQLCMYTTRYGINKQIFAKASKDALSSLGEPLFSRDDFVQSQCLQELGLGYIEPVNKMPDPVKSPPKPPQFSRSSPT